MADYTNVPNMKKQIDPLGRTYEDLQELADQQKWNEEPMRPGNMDPDTQIQKYTEKTHYWMYIHIPRFDPATGQPLTPPKLVCYNIRMYENFLKKNRLTGYDIKMVHDPKKELGPEKKSIFKKSTASEKSE